MMDYITYTNVGLNCSEPVPHPYNYMMDKLAGNGELNSHDGAKHPVVLMNSLGTSQLWITDPEMVFELFTTKNNFIDKVPLLEMMYKDLLGNSFLFSSGDKIWKAKRQACAHAFYKERLLIMSEVLRGKIEEPFENWIKEIDDSTTKSTNIDITVEFERIFAKNLIHIAFGEDISS